MKQIGKMICNLRIQKNISQKQLGDGILSISELHRIECGEKEAENMVFEALFQRLGKSLSRLEYFIPKEEYYEICLKELILYHIQEKEYEFANLFLEEYQLKIENKNILYHQSAVLLKGLLVYGKQKKIEESLCYLEKALEMTYKEWNNSSLEKKCLCVQEIQILLCIYYFRWKKQKVKLEQVTELLKYMDSYYTDKRERAKILPQCAWLAGNICENEANYGMALQLYQAGKICLIESGSLGIMDKLLIGERECLQRLNKKEEMEQVQKQIEAIQFLYEKTEYVPIKEEILLFLFIPNHRSMIMNNDMIRELRMFQNLSQEELSDGICAPETLSRIEKQKRKPQRRILDALLKKLNYERNRYQGYVITDNYYVYELVGEINECGYKGNVKQQRELLEKLKHLIDLEIPVNRQYVEYMEMIRKGDYGEISNIQEIVESERLLKLTLKDYDNKIYRALSRMEFLIILNIAICFKIEAKYQESDNIYRQIIEYYGDMTSKNQVDSMGLFYVNYVGMLEESDRLVEAEKVGWKGIRFLIGCGLGDKLGTLLGNIACIYEKGITKEAERMGKACLRNSYRLLMLYENPNDAKVISDYYIKKYGESIN